MLLQYIDRENLPEYLGGTSKASRHDLHSACARQPCAEPIRTAEPATGGAAMSSAGRCACDEGFVFGVVHQATLLDDAGPWNDQAVIDEIEAELKRVSPIFPTVYRDYHLGRMSPAIIGCCLLWDPVSA